jgi:hypothetical protein
LNVWYHDGLPSCRDFDKSTVYHMYLLNCLVELEGILDSSDFLTLLFKNRSRSFITPKAFASAQEFASQYE